MLMPPRGNSVDSDSTKGASTTGKSPFALKSDEMKGLNPNPKKETINEKMNAEKKVMGDPPSDKVDADNITQKEKPFSFQVDEGWTVHSNMRGKGESEKANANGTPLPAAGKLGQAGTPVTASKP